MVSLCTLVEFIVVSRQRLSSDTHSFSTLYVVPNISVIPLVLCHWWADLQRWLGRPQCCCRNGESNIHFLFQQLVAIVTAAVCLTAGRRRAWQTYLMPSSPLGRLSFWDTAETPRSTLLVFFSFSQSSNNSGHHEQQTSPSLLPVEAVYEALRSVPCSPST